MKTVFFAFKDEEMCFVHLLLNALDLKEKGYESGIVMEGKAVLLVKALEENPLFRKAREKGLILSICRACSAKLGVLEYNEACGIPLEGEMSGHVPMEPFLREGYQLIAL